MLINSGEWRVGGLASVEIMQTKNQMAEAFDRYSRTRKVVRLT
jgi:hypothetical protein